jgi:hypothetical protein
MKSTALEYADDDKTPRCTCDPLDTIARQGAEGVEVVPCRLHRPETTEAPPGRLADRLRAAFADAFADEAATGDQDGQHDDGDGQHEQTGPQSAAEALNDDQGRRTAPHPAQRRGIRDGIRRIS